MQLVTKVALLNAERPGLVGTLGVSWLSVCCTLHPHCSAVLALTDTAKLNWSPKTVVVIVDGGCSCCAMMAGSEASDSASPELKKTLQSPAFLQPFLPTVLLFAVTAASQE